MRWLDAVNGRFLGSRISDAEIERLLSGYPAESDELAELEGFVSSIQRDSGLPRDPGQMATALAATARTTRPSPRRAMRRVVALAATMAVLFGLSGVAMAADDAVPGDFLYPLDRALEQIGIGDGGVDERIVEFDILIQRGQDQEAFELLDEFAGSAPEEEAAKAERHIELAAAKSNVVAAAAQEKVAAKKAFIEENRGSGTGLEGRDFGQGVADLAGQGNQPDHSATQGPPDHAASSGSEPPGQSDDEPPGNPEQPSSTAPGQSETTGKSSSGNNSSGGNQGTGNNSSGNNSSGNNSSGGGNSGNDVDNSGNASGQLQDAGKKDK